MGGIDASCPVEIGYGSGHFQDAVESTAGQVIPIDRLGQRSLGLRSQGGFAASHGAGHFRIASGRLPKKPMTLAIARLLDSFPYIH
jgi:hypothetical protein